MAKTKTKPAAPPSGSTMPRGAVLELLKELSLGLSSKDGTGAVLQAFCFTGDAVHTFDDVVAVRGTLPKGLVLVGGVRGRTLMDWLGAATAADVEFETGPNVLRVKCGRARTELPLLSKDEFIFDVPAGEPPHFAISEELLSAIKRALVCIGDDVDVQWSYGATIAFHKTGASVFTCNGVVCFHGELPLVVEKLAGTIVQVPPAFVEVIAKRKAGTPLFVHGADWVQVSLAHTEAYGHLLPSPTLKTFKALYEGVDEQRAKSAPLPMTWWGMMNRAETVRAKKNDAYTRVTCAAGKVTVETVSDFGQARDSAALKGTHDDFVVRVRPDLLLQLPRECTSFRVMPDANPKNPPSRMAFFGPGFAYVTSVLGGE